MNLPREISVLILPKGIPVIDFKGFRVPACSPNVGETILKSLSDIHNQVGDISVKVELPKGGEYGKYKGMSFHIRETDPSDVNFIEDRAFFVSIHYCTEITKGSQ